MMIGTKWRKRWTRFYARLPIVAFSTYMSFQFYWQLDNARSAIPDNMFGDFLFSVLDNPYATAIYFFNMSIIIYCTIIGWARSMMRTGKDL